MVIFKIIYFVESFPVLYHIVCLDEALTLTTAIKLEDVV